MDADVYMAYPDVMGNLQNRLYENLGGRFQLVPDGGGAATNDTGTGGRVSVADYDNDGYMDLLVTDGRANLGFPFHFGRRFLLQNQGGSNHWVKFKLLGCQSNRDAVGARVRVLAGGVWQARTLGGGIHNGVQDDPRPNFGLAGNTAVQSVVVDWPSGASTTLSGLTADQIYTVHEDPLCARR